MRLRRERKAKKYLRRAGKFGAELLRAYRPERESLSVFLRSVVVRPDYAPHGSGLAARALQAAGEKPLAILLDLFRQQSDGDALYRTALTMESLRDPAAVPALIPYLKDPNRYRRRAAARALGWIPHRGHAAARALSARLVDAAEEMEVRIEAAESLAYRNAPCSVDPLIRTLEDPDPALRFWAVFALGSIQHPRSQQRRVRALERMLDDEAKPPGEFWWAVGLEALAQLARLQPDRYLPIFRQKGLAATSAEHKRCAEFYGDLA